MNLGADEDQDGEDTHREEAEAAIHAIEPRLLQGGRGKGGDFRQKPVCPRGLALVESLQQWQRLLRRSCDKYVDDLDDRHEHLVHLSLDLGAVYLLNGRGKVVSAFHLLANEARDEVVASKG